MFGFQAAACLSFFGLGGQPQSEAQPQTEVQSEAKPRIEASEESEEEMQSGAKEYELKWTTNPKTWNAQEPQSGYGHGRVTPQEVRKILEKFDDDKGNPDILLRDLNWRAMVKRAIKYPIEEWKLGKDPQRNFDGRKVIEDLKTAGIRIEVSNIKTNNIYGAWLMDGMWTELRCVLNISREDVEYVAVPNESYKAIPVTWPEGMGIEGWNEENTGNIWEAWAGTLWLFHQREATCTIRRLIFCALMAGGDTKIPLARYLIEKKQRGMGRHRHEGQAGGTLLPRPARGPPRLRGYLRRRR